MKWKKHTSKNLKIIEAIAVHESLCAEKVKGIGYCCTVQEALILLNSVWIYKPDVVFESGTAIGWSSFWLALASYLPVYTWDIEQREQYWNCENIIKLHGEFSVEVCPYLEEHKNSKKLIFIDSDHRKETVLAEFNTVSPYLKSGDIVIFHDAFTEPGVVKALTVVDSLYPEWKKIDYHTANGIRIYEVN